MEITVERFNNGKYNLNTISNDQYIGNTLKQGYEWDGWMRYDVEKYYKPGTDIIDIGANIGLFTLYAKDSASRIIAVEPTESHHYIFDKLTEDCTNVELSKVALSGEDGPITFYICEDNLTMNSLVNKKSKSVEVDGLCLESLLNKHIQQKFFQNYTTFL